MRTRGLLDPNPRSLALTVSQSLLKSIAAVGAGTAASRALGFVRDILIARVFGAGAGADAFFVAFRIPNFLRRLFAEGAFSQAFVPVLSEYRAQRSPEDVRDLLSHVFGALAAWLSVVSVLGVVSAPLLILVFAPGFRADPEKYELAVQLVRITFPYALFISLVAFAGGVLNAFGRFAVPALTPVLLNLCLIAAVLWLAPALEQPALALAIGVFAAGVVQLAFQFPFLAAIGMIRIRIRIRRIESKDRVLGFSNSHHPVFSNPRRKLRLVSMQERIGDRSKRRRSNEADTL
eukprot:XP_019857873.1 PREDICTED: uncharacterized protein LOC109586137 [Amphimedon queenslandica]